MLDGATIELVSALAIPQERAGAALTLAAHIGAEALVLLIEDREVGALLPAPGTAPTLVGGPTWTELLVRARTPGVVALEVAYPTLDRRVPASLCATAGAALVVIGAGVRAVDVTGLAAVMPLLAAAFRAEQQLAACAGELAVAREDAQRAAALARALDRARIEQQRQARSLAEAGVRAAAATRAKDEFMAMLGHELRNPLAPIVTALQVMATRGPPSREQDVVTRQVGQLMRLVDDLLDVSRVAQGKVELRRTRVELAATIERAIETAAPLLEEKGQALDVDVPARGALIDGDPERLAQIFSNLLTNAAKYSPGGTRIAVSAEVAPGRVIVRVRDQGVGIPAALLEAIFEQFVQQQQFVDRSQGGLGLGLAIVRNLVHLHGGRVHAESAGLGQGATFVVELPRLTDAVRASTEDVPRALADPPSQRTARAPLRILLVDDNLDAAQMLGEALGRRGHDVRTAPDGRTALTTFETFVPDVALLDIGLPGMDGHELARHLRAAPGGEGVRLIALSGYGQPSDKARSLDAGFDLHLVKPITLGALTALLEKDPRG